LISSFDAAFAAVGGKPTSVLFFLSFPRGSFAVRTLRSRSRQLF
jgi:hypothetical protein